jgi:AcrR family transcriptional regulator
MANEEVKMNNLGNVLSINLRLFYEHGIENVTKEMVAKESGLSRRTIDRYFNNKTELVIHTLEWNMLNIQNISKEEKYSDEVFTDGNHKAIDLLRMYMNDIKELFLKEPKQFVLYSEVKSYVYRNCTSKEQEYTLFANKLGNQKLRKKIFNFGMEDGTIKFKAPVDVEEEYFCESFFGFLANVALSYSLHTPEEIIRQIDERIDNTIFLYSIDR